MLKVHCVLLDDTRYSGSYIKNIFLFGVVFTKGFADSVVQIFHFSTDYLSDY